MQFAATACTIVSGAIAERARFESYILYTSFMAAWVYPIVTHASWSPSSYIGMFRWDAGQPPGRREAPSELMLHSNKSAWSVQMLHFDSDLVGLRVKQTTASISAAWKQRSQKLFLPSHAVKSI